MRMLEYKLHAPMNGHGMSTPVWVTNGGHWYDQDNNTMIGFAPDTTEYYIPDSVDFFTLAELQARQVALHQKYPMHKYDPSVMPHGEGDVMTDAEVETAVDEWHTAVNV